MRPIDEKEAERLLKITAGETSVTPNIGSYYQALALRDLGQPEKAEQMLADLKTEAEKLIDRGANNAFGYYYLAKVQEVSGQTEQAQENLEKALSIDLLAERQAIYRAQVGYARTNQ